MFYVSNSILNQVGFLITKFDFARILLDKEGSGRN